MKNTKLQGIIDDIEPNRRPIAQKILEELEFMQKVLSDLKATIKESGVVDISGEMLKESPAIKSYNQTVKSYCNCLKQLEILLRKGGVKIEEKNELQAFLEASK